MSNISKSVRERVRLRAGQRCEYCLKPDSASHYPHHIEHILPLKHGGGSTMDNLAWACFQCNVYKGSNVAGYDPETKTLAPVHNPRTQDWDENFEYIGAVAKGKTAVGRVTIVLFKINHPTQIEARQVLIDEGRW